MYIKLHIGFAREYKDWIVNKFIKTKKNKIF